MKILVTGGAGFIGSFLVDELVKKGHQVIIYDNLEPQVHPGGKKPPYLNAKARFIKADITDAAALNRALNGIDIVYHEAAMVGVGQSMYEVEKYTRVNTYGTAVLLDLIVNKHRNHIKKMIVAASMSEYGEGLYHCTKCGYIKPALRRESMLKKCLWEPICPDCNSALTPKPTSEKTPTHCSSIYALNKRDQEDMFITIGKSFKIPAVALRYFNVYGPRQSLSNPYTGVAAIFISRIKAGNRPVVFEDGNQSRDFVSVHDIAAANLAVMNNPKADYEIFNVGSGHAITIAGLARKLISFYKSTVDLEITNRYRRGDIRHCFADISKIKRRLGWKPQIKMEAGLHELIKWSKTTESTDRFEEAHLILKSKGVL